MNSIIDNIVSYINYLKKDCGLTLSIHFRNNIFSRMHGSLTSALLLHNHHTNSYCSMIKKTQRSKCLLNQKEIFEKCRRGESFCHFCHAEVYEYIYPVFKDDVAVGIISVSGYRRDNPWEENILNYDLWKSALETEIPFSLCNAVIPPLSIMLENALQLYLMENENEYNQILQFLYEYHTNITLSDLTRHFNRSKSHISHLFKKENGMTIRAYLNKLKLEDSKKLLEKTDMSVTEIALNSGFNDTSYFIYLFKDKFGISPLQYRKQYINEENLK